MLMYRYPILHKVGLDGSTNQRVGAWKAKPQQRPL